MTADFDGAVVTLDPATAARLASALRSLARYRDRDGASMPADLLAVCAVLDRAAAAALSVPQRREISSAGVRVEERLTVAEAAERVGVTTRAIRKMAAADPRLTGCRNGREWWIPASVADEWAERRYRTVTRAAIAAADATMQRLAAELAALDTQVSDVESRLDAARRELDATRQAADLAAARGDAVSEVWGRETADEVAATVDTLTGELHRLNAQRTDLLARHTPMERARREVQTLRSDVALATELAGLLTSVDKAIATAQAWDHARAAFADEWYVTGRPALVSHLLSIEHTIAYEDAKRRAKDLDSLRARLAEAEVALVAATTVDEGEGR